MDHHQDISWVCALPHSPSRCFIIHLVLQVSRRLADPLVAAPPRAEEGGAVAGVQVAEAEAAHHRLRGQRQ